MQRIEEIMHLLQVQIQEIVRLQGADRDPVYAEVTARTYDTHDNERRIVCIGRDATRRGTTKGAPGQATSAETGSAIEG